MSYRAWPTVLLTGAALSGACVVVGEHVVDARDGCLDSAGWFIATPAAGPNGSTDSGASTARVVVAYPVSRSGAPADGKTAYTDEVGQTSGHPTPDGDPISGCMDLNRIEIPAREPAPDGRA